MSPLPGTREHLQESETGTRSTLPALLTGVRTAWHSVFGEALGRVEQDTRAYLNSAASLGPDYKTITVLVTAAVCLSIQRYLFFPDLLTVALKPVALAGGSEFAAWSESEVRQLADTRIGSLLFWCLTCCLTYFVIPSLVIRLLLRERLRDYGVKLQGAFAGFWIYAVMMGVMVPLVLAASRNRHFQATYPFYPLRPEEALWPGFCCWEMLYALQFLALEFFFRGFMLHGTRHRFGIYAVFVMMVPYCMIHFGKPVQETFAAIVAGIALGLMSLKTRSIWMGAVLHVSVALSMDFSSLWRKGFFS
jgi:membrane protease YdiL (CAAX protease family)